MIPDSFIGARVFVYGTLRAGFVNNPATIAFRSGATFLARGQLPGALYSVGWYPALIEGEPGHVTGEVWEITARGTMAVLDEYEGVHPDPALDDGEYERVRRVVETELGPIEAWVYLYREAVDPRQIIPSGDWSDAFNDPARDRA